MRYSTVVIDPPWKVDAVSRGVQKEYGYGMGTTPYKTMTDDEICEFDPVATFADTESCAVFIWATHSKLPFVLNDLLDAWHLKYASLITWNKDGGITLLGLHKNTEFAVFAYRGTYPLSPKVALPTGFYAPRGRHSEKPEKFYDILRRCTPGPRLDVFARRRHYNFHSYGDQVEPPLPTLDTYRKP